MMSFTLSSSPATPDNQSIACCCGVLSSAMRWARVVSSSLSQVCLVHNGPCGPYCFCQQSHAKWLSFLQKKQVRTFLVPSFCTGPLGRPPSLFPPTHCSYCDPPGRKSSASAILAQVLPRDISMALESCGGFLHCILFAGFQLFCLVDDLPLVLNWSTQFHMWIYIHCWSITAALHCS
jgi:hypothetical protein